MHAEIQTLRTVWDEFTRVKDENLFLKDELVYLRRVVRHLNDLQYRLDAITPETNVLDLINKVLSAAIDAVNSEDGSLMLVDEDTAELVFVEVIGTKRDELMGYRIPITAGIAGWVIQNREPSLVPDVSKDNRWTPTVDDFSGYQTGSIISVPLMDNDRPLGVIEVVNPRPKAAFQDEDLDILLLIAKLASLVIMRAEDAMSVVE